MIQTEPEQWAQQLADDWDIECMHCSEYEGNWPHDFALAIQAAFDEREANAWKEADRQEALAKVYLRAQLAAEAKLCREIDNAKGWQKRAKYLEEQLASLKDRTHG